MMEWQARDRIRELKEQADGQAAIIRTCHAERDALKARAEEAEAALRANIETQDALHARVAELEEAIEWAKAKGFAQIGHVLVKALLGGGRESGGEAVRSASDPRTERQTSGTGRALTGAAAAANPAAPPRARVKELPEEEPVDRDCGV